MIKKVKKAGTFLVPDKNFDAYYQELKKQFKNSKHKQAWMSRYLRDQKKKENVPKDKKYRANRPEDVEDFLQNLAMDRYFKKVYKLNEKKIEELVDQNRFINNLKGRTGEHIRYIDHDRREVYVDPRKAVKEYSRTRDFLTDDELAVENIQKNLSGSRLRGDLEEKRAYRNAIKERLGIPKNRKIDWSRFEWDDIEQKFVVKDENGQIKFGLSFEEYKHPYYRGQVIFKIEDYVIPEGKKEGRWEIVNI